MSEAFSPLFLCSYLVWLSEARPRQCSSVPVQHAVSQRLQVTASGWSWNGIKQTTVNRLHQLWTLRINVTVSVCKLFLYKKKNCQWDCCVKMLLPWILPNVSIIPDLTYVRVFFWDSSLISGHWWLTCSFMHVQADELYGALVWRLAAFTVFYMFSAWTEPESVVVSNQKYLTTPIKHTVFSGKKLVFRNVRMLSKNFHLWFVSLQDINVFGINISMNILICMDILQDI